jgi:dTDP-4-dehydrorhamnose 3,5-epimerase
MMYVPPGFAHGFLVISDFADFIYKCTDYYHPQSEQGVLWDDPDIGVEWPIGGGDVLLSEKDKRNLALKDQPEALLPLYPEA